MLNLKSFEEFNESVWNDIRKQSAGKDERMEDIITINRVSDGDLEYIYKYFVYHYEPTGDTFIDFKRYPEDMGGVMELYVPISRGDTNMFLIDNEEYDPNDPGSLRLAKMPREYYKYADRKFCMDMNVKSGGNSIWVYFNGDLKNHDTVYFIETLWERVPDPAYIKKKGLKKK